MGRAMKPVDVAMRVEREERPAASRSILVGLIGAGIQASRTPAMHEREGAAQGVTYIYKIIDLETLGLSADALPELLTAARRFGFAGLNITHPCKQAVIPLLDDLSPDARALGAVNTVVFGREGRAVGYNTDWSGFAEAFRRNLSDARRNRSGSRLLLFGRFLPTGIRLVFRKGFSVDLVCREQLWRLQIESR